MDSKRRLLAALAVAGALGAMAIVPAIAQDATEPSDEATAPDEVRASHEAAFAAALAEELGLEAADVEAAITAVREQLRADVEAERRAALEARWNEAVEAGDLTQEQADALLAALDAGVLPFGGHHGPGGFRRFRHGDRGFEGPAFGAFEGGPVFEVPGLLELAPERATS